MRTAAIVTIGTELTYGLRTDTNSAEIARALTERGLTVTETVSVPDDADRIARTLERLVAEHDVVITTGGLGPTHDDVTRQAAARALGRRLVRDERLARLLAPAVERHRDPRAAAQVLRQADVIEGADVLDFSTGTAPGLVVPTAAGVLALLPGPPEEMRPMLAMLLERLGAPHVHVRDLGVAEISESDAQVAAEDALAGVHGVRLTVLARPGDVRIVLAADGAGQAAVDEAADRVAAALGRSCYTTTGRTLAEVLVERASNAGRTISVAESCTGGMVAAAITSVPGSSVCFVGGVVAYSNSLKQRALGVSDAALAAHGAVSEAVAREMADGVRSLTGTDLSCAVTGIAGPSGGSAVKPVGLVCFAVSSESGTESFTRRYPPSGRAAVRERATATALHALLMHLDERS